MHSCNHTDGESHHTASDSGRVPTNKVQSELMTDCQTQQFGKYFDKQYGYSTEEWASCHRLVRNTSTV